MNANNANSNSNAKIEEEYEDHEYQILSPPYSYSKGQKNIQAIGGHPEGVLFFKNGAPKDFGFEFVPEGISPRNFRENTSLLEENREKLLNILKEEFTKYKIAFEDITQRQWTLTHSGSQYLSFVQTINLDPKQKKKNFSIGPSVRIILNAIPGQFPRYISESKDETSMVMFINVDDDAMDKIAFVLDKAFIKYLKPESPTAPAAAAEAIANMNVNTNLAILASGMKRTRLQNNNIAKNKNRNNMNNNNNAKNKNRNYGRTLKRGRPNNRKSRRNRK